MSFDEHDQTGCWTCGMVETEDQPCQCNCDHSDMDDCCCLICGKDRTEDLMAAAYDYAKGLRQDG